MPVSSGQPRQSGQSNSSGSLNTAPLTSAVAELFPRQGEWTEQDYWPLSDRNRVLELSEGTLLIPPMPTTIHQEVVLAMAIALRMHAAAAQAGEVAYGATVAVAPLPVKLWHDKIREPDVMLMLAEHRHRIHRHYWEPPDLAIEVISPHTKRVDCVEKVQEYAAAGISEYWIIFPDHSSGHSRDRRAVEVYTKDEADQHYTNKDVYTGNETIHSHLLPDITLTVAELFASCWDEDGQGEQ